MQEEQVTRHCSPRLMAVPRRRLRPSFWSRWVFGRCVEKPGSLKRKRWIFPEKNGDELEIHEISPTSLGIIFATTKILPFYLGDFGLTLSIGRGLWKIKGWWERQDLTSWFLALTQEVKASLRRSYDSLIGQERLGRALSVGANGLKDIWETMLRFFKGHHASFKFVWDSPKKGLESSAPTQLLFFWAGLWSTCCCRRCLEIHLSWSKGEETKQAFAPIWVKRLAPFQEERKRSNSSCSLLENCLELCIIWTIWDFWGYSLPFWDWIQKQRVSTWTWQTRENLP